MANFLDDLSTYNAKAALAISNAVAAGDTQKANMMNSLKSTANDTTLTEAVRLNALTALVNIGMLLDIPLPPYFPSVVTYDNAPVYQGIHNDLDGLQGGQTGEYFHLTQAQFNNLANAATLADINFAQLGGSYTQNNGLNTAINSKQNILNGTGFVKVSGTTVSYDNSTYLTASTGIVSAATFGGQVSGTYNALTLSNDAVIGKLLTNWNGSATYSAITASDSILSGMEKLNARISTIVANPGGVLNVKLATNASNVFTVTTTAQTGAATLNVNLNTQNKNLFLASSASTNTTQPAFRAIENSDLPTSGVATGSYGTTTKIPVISVNDRGIVTSVTEVNAAAGGGQVNSVTMSVPSSGTIYTATGSGTTNVTVGFTVVAQSPNTVYAGPSSGVSSAVPGFRPLVAADIANIPIPQSQVTDLGATLATFLQATDLSDGTIWIGSSVSSAIPQKFTGDVTVTNAGVTAIGAKKVQFPMIRDITAKKLLGRYSTVDGEPEMITLSGDFVLSNLGTLSLQNPVAPVVTTKGDLLSWTAATNSQGRFPSSNTDGDILMVLGGAAGDFGLKWTTVSGDISVTNASAGTFSIGANKVTFAKMQTIANGTILGNNSGSTAIPSALTATQVTALLNQFTSDGSGGNAGLQGLVPPGNITLPVGKTLADYVLTAAGSWVAAAGTGTVTGVSVATDNGFAGSATSTSTPVITIKLNNLSGMLKGNGSGVIQSATAGTDYVAPGVITQTSGAGSGLTMVTNRLLGRTTAIDGPIEAISVDSSLSLALTTLGINLGNINIFTVQQQMTSIQLNGSTSGFVSFTPPATAGTQNYTLPTGTPGGAGQFLTSTTGGALSWASPAGSGTTTNAVTFNSGGSGAASGTTFNGSTDRTISYNTIGAQALNANLTGLSGLTYVSGSPLIRMTAAGTFTLDAATYVTGTATQYAVLVGGAANTVASVTGGAAGQVLRYVSGANPAWSTATYPNTTSINRILYSSANDVVDQIVAPSDATFLRYTTAGGYSWQSAVTSLGFGTQGLITNGGTAAAPVLAVSGNSGGVVYFSNATTWASSGTLDQYELVVGGGAGSPPITINNSATAGTILTSNGNSNNPSWTAATYPTSTSINRILFSSANNVIDEIVAPNTADTFLKWDGTTFTWAAAGGGGGSGTVSTGTIGQLAYYTGTTTVGSFSAANSIIYNNNLNNVAALPFGTEANKYLRVNGSGTGLIWDTVGGGTVTSVGLTMPSAFNVSVPNPITTSGTFTVTGAGTASQYVRGDGTLGIFPSIGGGGGGSVYYLNGGVTASPSSIGGVAMKQLSKAPITAGASVDFTANTNGAVLASFLTDTGDPNQTSIPAGIWVFECYLSAAGGGPSHPTVEAVVEKWDGTNLSVIATGPAEEITNGATKDLYQFAVTIPTGTNISLSDRIVVQIKVVAAASKTITLYTQNGNVSSVTTTFPNGIASLNGLTAATQLFANGSSGTAPAFVSSTATHTLNIPLASASSVTAGLISKTEYDTFNGKLANVLTTTGDIIYSSGGTTAARLGIGTANQVLAVSAGLVPEWKTISGTGDVVGPAGAVTNGNFAVFDTSGQIIKESVAASLSAAGAAVFNTSLALGVSGPTGTTGQLVFRNSSNAFTTTLQASTSASANAIYTWPQAQAGSAGLLLANDGAGNLSWTAAGAGNMILASTQTNTGAKTFNSGTLILAGSTSGTTTLNSGAAAGSSVLTLPITTSTLAALGLAQNWSQGQTFQAGVTLNTAGTFSSAVRAEFSGTPFSATAGTVTINPGANFSVANPHLSINSTGTNITWMSFGSAALGGSGGILAPANVGTGGATRSAGTKIVLYAAPNATSMDVALGVESGAMWLSAGSSATNPISIKFYVQSSASTAIESVGQFENSADCLGLKIPTLGTASKASLFLSGAGTSASFQFMRFGGQGIGLPSLVSSRSPGTRIILIIPGATNLYDNAIGISDTDVSTVWFSSIAAFSFWSNNGTGGTQNNVLKLSGTAVLNLPLTTGRLQINGTQVVGPRTGTYGTPTNPNRANTWDSNTITATDANLRLVAGSLAGLIADLKTHGLIG